MTLQPPEPPARAWVIFFNILTIVTTIHHTTSVQQAGLKSWLTLRKGCVGTDCVHSTAHSSRADNIKDWGSGCEDVGGETVVNSQKATKS